MKKHNQMRRYAAFFLARGLSVRAQFDIARARDEAQTLLTGLRADREALAERQLAGNANEAEMKALRDKIAANAQRYDDLMGAVRMHEGEAASRVAEQFNQRQSEAQGKRAMRGSMYKSLLTGRPFEPRVQAAMSLPTVTDGESGKRSVLLPQTHSTDLLTEIFDDEGFLSAITMTNQAGLTMPRVSTSDVEGDDVAEGTAAPDATLEEGLVTFGRYPYAKNVTVPNSMLDDNNVQLESYITSRHYNLMRTRVQKRIFDAEATSKYQHMSVYDANEVNVKEMTAANLLDGIIAALADLPDEVRGMAKVALTPAAWLSMVRELTNGAATLFGTPDQAVLGFVPVLTTYATTPIVGDLKTIQVNFDSAVRFETERHAKERVTDMVLSTFFDIHVLQPERLRKIKVNP